MAVTVNGFTWNTTSDTTGQFLTTDANNNIGIRSTCLYSFTAYKDYGSAHLFFDLSYIPQNNGKLRIEVKKVTATNEGSTHWNWRSCTGTIKANGVTIFEGTLSSSDGNTQHGAGQLCTLTGGNVKYGVIDYNSNSQGSMSIKFESNFGMIHDFTMVWGGQSNCWTDSGGGATNSHTITYSHTHTLKYTTTRQPTCTTTGIQNVHCTSCEYSHDVSLPAEGHIYSNATCTAPQTCSVCGHTIGEPLGHTWDGGVITTPSTYETTGIKTHTCLGCGDLYKEVLAKLSGAAYIANGAGDGYYGYDGYGIYIYDDDEKYNPYILYVYDGNEFIPYGGESDFTEEPFMIAILGESELDVMKLWTPE